MKTTPQVPVPDYGNNKGMVYIHDDPPSFLSKILQSYMGIVNFRERMEKRIVRGDFSTEPAPVPKRFKKKFHIEDNKFADRNYWILKPPNNQSEKVVIYIHGGAYVSNIISQHWSLIGALIDKTNATVVVPNYQTAPYATYREVYDFINSLYKSLPGKYKPENIIFMGDSAGAGLALGYAMYLRDNDMPQPSRIILLSPWLDITMSNPGIGDLEKKDKMLAVKGLVMAGELYARNISKTDYRVSPIYGDLNNLGKISVFISTNDLCYADTRKLHEALTGNNITHDYFEYPGMFHAWVAVTSLKESMHAISQISDLIGK